MKTTLCSFYKPLIAALLLLVSVAGWGQVTIVTDGLNNSSSLFTLSNGTYYTGNSAKGDRPVSIPFAFEGTHSRGVSNDTATLISSDVNTSLYTSVSLTFKLASFSISSTTNGVDSGDIVTIEVSPDGGANYYNTVRVLGNSNAYWGYSATGNASTAYDGNTTSADFQPTGGGNRTTDGYSTVEISNLPAVTNLRVKITMLNNDAKERWVIDDFKIIGTPVTNYPEPTNHPTLFSCGTTGTTSIPLTWTDAIGGTIPTGYLVKWSSVSYDAIIPPTDGTQEANGAGVQNVASGAQSLSVTGLSPNATYYFKIWPYTNSGTNINYKTDGTIQQTNCTTQNGPCFTGNAPSFSTSGSTATGDVDTGGSPTNTIKLATGTDGGSVATTATGVSTGDITVRFRAKAWTGTETQVTVKVGDQSVLYEKLTTVFEWHEVTFTNVPADPTLTFSTIKDKRLHLGNVEIYCGPLVPTPRITVTQNTTNIPNSTGSYGFGNQVIGSSSAATTFTIKNTGTLDLTLGSLSLTGTDLGQFAITQPALGTTTLAPGATTTFTATFSPSSTGAKTATVNIPNNTTTSPYTFNVTGAGTLNTIPYNALNLNACIGNEQVTLNWTASSGTPTPTGYIVYALEGTTSPVMSANSAGNANTYTANSEFISATAYGTLGKAVYKGNGTSATITGLTTGNQYTFKVVAYNGETATGWASGIASTSPQSWWQTYTAKVPEVTNLAATVATTSSLVTWNVVPTSSGCYEYLVVANQGAVTFTPSGSAYTANTVYSGPNQVVYKAIGTGNSVTVTGLTEGLQYCYKVFVREVNSNQWSDGVSECQTTGLSYCSNASANSSDNGITGVEFNTINNPSTAINSYTDFTSVNTTVNIGESYELSIKVKTYSNTTSYIKAWIDWNRNGIFDSGEDYDLGTATSVTDGYTSESPVIVTVPTNAVIGNIRMRVISKQDSAPTACTNYFYGETEDYTITIGKPANAEINIKGQGPVANISIPSGSTAVNGLNNTLFAPTDVGSSSIEKTFIIENLGKTTLSLTSTPIVELTGDNPGDFTVTAQPAATTIAVDGTQTFKIKFNPTTSGVLSAIVSISNNDPTGDENPYTFKIQGTGQCTTAPVITMTPTAGPAHTIVTLTSSVNDLSGATVKLNGATLTPESITSGEIKVKIPEGAEDGDITVRLATGCVFTQAFDVITYENAGCEGSSGTLATDLIIYELYDEDGGSGGYISIYNGTSSTKNLANYDIYRAKTLSEADEESFIQYTFGLTGTIAPGELKIIRVAAENKCTTPESTGNGQLRAGFNDGDVMRLTNIGGTVVYDEVHAPNYVGYYMKRVAGKMGNNVTHDPASWTTVDVGPNDCLPGGVAPQLPGGAVPTITTQPDFTPSCQSIVLSVVGSEGVTGGNGLAHQWYFLAPDSTTWSAVADGGVYTGATTNQLTISSAAGLNNYQYYAQVRENGASCYTASHAVQIKDPETKWTGTEWTNGTPKPYSKVIIEGDYDTQTNGALDICELTVNSGHFVIKNDFPVKVQNKVTNKAGEDHFIIESDGQLWQYANIANEGRITAKKNIKFRNDERKEYNYLISPVIDQSLKTIYSGISSVLYYNEATNYFGNSTGAYIQGRALAVKEPSKTVIDADNVDAIFKGVPKNGYVPFSLGFTNDVDYGFNLVGNPYPSNINLRELYKANGGSLTDPNVKGNIGSTFFFWDNRANNIDVQQGTGYNGRAYAIYNAVSDIGNKAGYLISQELGTQKPNGIVKVGQGFMVRATSKTTLEFNNAIRTTEQTDASFFSKGDETPRNRYWLKLQTPANAVNTLAVVYLEGGAYTVGMEDSKLKGNTSDMFYTTIEDQRLQIDGRPLFTVTDKLNLGTKSFGAGDHVISIEQAEGIFANEQPIYLKDKQKGIITNLSQGSYSFTTEAGENNNRFEIVYQEDIVLAVNNDSLSGFKVYVAGKEYVAHSDAQIINRAEIYDPNGRLIMKLNGNNTHELRFGIDEFPQGLYLIKAYFKNGNSTTKKIRK